MGQISNRILISSVNDGTTIHGSLRANVSLTQGWDGAAATPDWTAEYTDPQHEDPEHKNPFYHPQVYLALFDGQNQTTPTTYKWYYNGIELDFDPDTGLSRNQGYAGWFYAYIGEPDVDGSGLGNTCCLRIMVNLASSNNTDIDLISISGTKEIGGSPVSFEAGVDVTISKVSSTGYLGVIQFKNGKSTLDGDNDTVEVGAYLYKGGSLVPRNECIFRWYQNGTSIGTGLGIIFHGTDIVDIATIQCQFYHNPNGQTTVDAKYLQDTRIVVIDDVGDPEYLYIRYTIGGQVSNNDGAPVSLHSGQSVTYKMWVAHSDNSNNPYALTKLEVQSHKADGTLVTSSTAPTVFAHSSSNLKTAGNYDGNGWCKIGEKPSGGSYSPNVTTDNGSTSANGGSFTVHYDDVSGAGANISMIVRATLA